MENLIINNQPVTLTERLNQNNAAYRYLLLDPLKRVAGVNPLHLYNLKLYPGERAIYPILRRDLAYTPEHCPQLVLLASPGEECNYPWLDGTEDYSRGEALHDKRYLCGWLASSQKPEHLSVSLAECCVRIKEGAFLPFFEPLRFELLQAMSKEDELAGSIWPVERWWYISAAGNMVCQKGKPVDEKWRFNWGTEIVQQNIRAIWQLLFSWSQVSPALPHDAAVQAASAWKSSAATRLSSPVDRNFMALNRLTLGIDIAEHPAVSELIQQAVANPSQRISRLLQTLPDAVWRELESQLAARQNSNSERNHYGA